MSGRGPDADDESQLADVFAKLSAEQGLDFIHTRRLVCLLTDGSRHGVSDLVGRTGASRRLVEELLEKLRPWLRGDGDGFQAAPPHTGALRGQARCDALLPAGFDRPDLDEPRLAGLLGQMREAAAGLPPSVWRLDHVPATAETAVQRAYALWANYDLAGRHVLCLGDHDLTSVALTLFCPDLRVTVVDIDERILAYIDGLSARWDLPIRCAFADLRAELPPSLREETDLVFTDPPYTPAGIELFLARGITGLQRSRASRLLFCYSHNERQLARGLEVQNTVGRLQLALEGLLPRFNEFVGAESIGSRSALWLCQPTANAWPAAERRTGAVAIYTRGRQAEETADRAPATVLETLRARAAADGEDVDAAQTVGTGDDAAFPLDALLRTEPPAGQGGMVRPGALLLADLTEVHPSYAYRLLLRGLPVRRALIAVSAEAARHRLDRAEHPGWQLVGAKYDISLHGSSDGGVLVEATLRPAGDTPDRLRAARYVLDHPKARLAGAWREALVAGARQQSQTLSKNQARQMIADAVDPRSIDGRYLCELPESTLAAVAAALSDVDLSADGAAARATSEAG